MGLGLLAATEKILGETDEAMSVGQIAIQRQRPLAFSDALSCAFRKYLHGAQKRGPEACCGAMDKALIKAASAAAKALVRSSVDKVAPQLVERPRQTDHRLDIFGIERQGALEKTPRLRHVFGVIPLFQQALPWKYKSIASGCSERSARRASASMSWASSVLASLDTISSCISKRSATGLSKRSAQR